MFFLKEWFEKIKNYDWLYEVNCKANAMINELKGEVRTLEDRIIKNNVLGKGFDSILKSDSEIREQIKIQNGILKGKIDLLRQALIQEMAENKYLRGNLMMGTLNFNDIDYARRKVFFEQVEKEVLQ